MERKIQVCRVTHTVAVRQFRLGNLLPPPNPSNSSGDSRKCGGQLVTFFFSGRLLV